MIIDSSALLAILLDEPEKGRFLDILTSATDLRMSVASYVEVGLKIDGLAKALNAELDAVLAALDIELVPLTAQHAMIARVAHVRYGRGVHPARLNFGDCLTYALAKSTGEPLLFKGDDFGLTDLELVTVKGD